MKLRLTAFSMSSIDMNRVMMLRRNRNPATPSMKSTALRIRYQEIGTPVILVHLLHRENYGADDRDQNQQRGHFERQQVSGEQRAADVLGCTAGESAEVDGCRVREQAQDGEAEQGEQCEESG